MYVNSKLIRKFKNNQNTIFEIRKKINNHYYLTEKKANEIGAKTVATTKFEILNFLHAEYKNNHLQEIKF